MTRKDYIAIAAIIAQAQPAVITGPSASHADRVMSQSWADGRESARVYIARNLSNVLQQDNPNFDRQRFLTACGVQQ